jgi:4'-phosphopantetheinyl transferase
VQTKAWPVPSDVPVLQPQDIHVWRASLTCPPEAYDRFWRLLSADERARAERIISADRRAQLIAAHGILRTLLGGYLGRDPRTLSFGVGPQGKPMLQSGRKPTRDLRFNLSHSHEHVLYAFAWGREVGVDVECIREHVDVLKLAARFFAPREASALRERPPEERRRLFFTLWVCREACLKAWGIGLTVPLNQLEVELIPGQSSARVTIKKSGVETRSGRVRLLPLDGGYVGAVAAEGERARIRCWQWKESEGPDSMR